MHPKLNVPEALVAPLRLNEAAGVLVRAETALGLVHMGPSVVSRARIVWPSLVPRLVTIVASTSARLAVYLRAVYRRAVCLAASACSFVKGSGARKALFASPVSGAVLSGAGSRWSDAQPGFMIFGGYNFGG
jgi:hypothetical protein